MSRGATSGKRPKDVTVKPSKSVELVFEFGKTG
jgi:hypothetical protein